MRKYLFCTAALLCVLLLCGAALADEVPVSSASATSWIIGTYNPELFMPGRMIDGREDTAFQFSMQVTPLSEEYVYLRFAEPSDIDMLWIKNGYWLVKNGTDEYYLNSRVKSMTVDFLCDGAEEYADPVVVNISDNASRSRWTGFDLGSHHQVCVVRFQIQEVYTGSRFPNDVCISEVKFTWEQKESPFNGMYGLAITKLATWEGPSTKYKETGTYFVSGEYIRVLARAYDKLNGIWWVKCEIPYRDEMRTLWTGYYRFSSKTLPLEAIPIEGGDEWE